MTTVTQPAASATSRLTEYAEWVTQLAAWAYGSNRHSTHLWSIAWGVRRESQRWLRDVRSVIDAAGLREIDPDDVLTDRLLAAQVRIKATIQELRERHNLLRLPGLWLPRWMLRRAEREFARVHAALGQARTLVLEHDADCSPVSESFTSAQDLIDAFKRAEPLVRTEVSLGCG